MPLIRTTMTPHIAQQVTDEVADDLRAQGALLEGTRATSDDGLREAAERQVRERTYDDATRAGIARSEAIGDEQRRRRAKKAATPRAPRKAAARRRGAPTDTAAPAAAPDAPPAGDGDTDGAAPADTVTDTSGDVPADATTQES